MKNYIETIIPSFYGGDGGNINYPIWFCGIEHGGDFEKNINEINISQQKNETFDTPSSWQDDDYKSSILATGHFNRYLAAFLGQFENLLPEDDQYNLDESFVEKHKIFYKEGIGFKMNLFPFRFKNLSTRNFKKLEKSLGTEDYIETTIESRGNFYLEKVKKHSPKIIICLGITQLNYYKRFFKCDQMHPNNIILNNKNITSYQGIINKGKTHFIVTPYIGRPHGPNGYQEIYQFADFIKDNFFIKK